MRKCVSPTEGVKHPRAALTAGRPGITLFNKQSTGKQQPAVERPVSKAQTAQTRTERDAVWGEG